MINEKDTIIRDKKEKTLTYVMNLAKYCNEIIIEKKTQDNE